MTKTAPFVVEVHNRRSAASKKVDGRIEVTVTPRFTKCIILIPDRCKLQWRYKSKHEAYLMSITAAGFNPSKCGHWGRAANEIINKLYLECTDEKRVMDRSIR